MVLLVLYFQGLVSTNGQNLQDMAPLNNERSMQSYALHKPLSPLRGRVRRCYEGLSNERRLAIAIAQRDLTTISILSEICDLKDKQYQELIDTELMEFFNIPSATKSQSFSQVLMPTTSVLPKKLSWLVRFFDYLKRRLNR
ncbi:MAG TPA: hypothetical protein VHA52_02940 [Candidatus Babeliaceae bacterium]|nr:hypothetical protein [Candidatus Babeliaceae bacterium]